MVESLRFFRICCHSIKIVAFSAWFACPLSAQGFGGAPGGYGAPGNDGVFGGPEGALGHGVIGRRVNPDFDRQDYLQNLGRLGPTEMNPGVQNWMLSPNVTTIEGLMQQLTADGLDLVRELPQFRNNPQADEFLDNLRKILPPSELERFKSRDDLIQELKRRGFLRRNGDDFMIFNGNDIGGVSTFLGDPPPRFSGASRAPNSFMPFPFTPFQFPRPEVRNLIWHATGVILTPAETGIPSELTSDGYAFSDLQQLGDLAGNRKLCEAGIAEEPLFGGCSGVAMRAADGGVEFLTARHCLRTAEASTHPTYAFFDYDDLAVTPGTRRFTSRNFARLDMSRARIDADSDIAAVPLEWVMGTPPRPVKAAPPDQPAGGANVGSIGYPLGRPRKQVFGPKVTVGWREADRFGAYVDSFAVSSGSPVFNFDGQVLGVLSFQDGIVDWVTRGVEDQCVGLAVVSRLRAKPPEVVRVTALD